MGVEEGRRGVSVWYVGLASILSGWDNEAQDRSSLERSCRFALYNIRKIRPYLNQYATQILVQAMVTSRLDYCNALLAGLPACSIKPLQKVQNAAARLVFEQPKRAHVTPLLTDLHWLPSDFRVCTYLPKLNYNGLHPCPGVALITTAPTGLALLKHKAISVEIIRICSSPMLKAVVLNHRAGDR
ncbi:hypothetical protein N1851_032556 [Merluccius polli]|uniref:Uncharacterized protein n=1 Tax=Merluccius polli TaxID=89951 RepID=A0AA47M310_MERPO|nr:hypothetical protein N1851_032556 [Merluccius polli]